MANEPQSFEVIYAEYREKIFRYLKRIIGEKDAEDLTQEVFIKVGQALPAFKNESKLSTWLYQIATNAATDKLRSRTHKQDAAIFYSAEAISNGIQCGEAEQSVEDQLVRSEMNECIQAYVEYLPDTYRTILVLSETEGLKNREIAEILGVSLDTVKIRLHRAKEKLKEQLIANCIFYRTDCNQLACEPKGPFRKKQRRQ